MTRRALVLGGGGYAASAWEIGLIMGMFEAGFDVRNADLFVGNSAGARVALHLASGVALEELSWGAYAQVHSLPNHLRWSTGYNFAAP
jgi:NTE family protein